MFLPYEFLLKIQRKNRILKSEYIRLLGSHRIDIVESFDKVDAHINTLIRLGKYIDPPKAK